MMALRAPHPSDAAAPRGPFPLQHCDAWRERVASATRQPKARAPSEREPGEGESLLRRGAGVDELRQPGIALLQVGAIHRLELGLRERVGRGALHQGLGPRLEARVLVHDAELLDAVEEDVAL